MFVALWLVLDVVLTVLGVAFDADTCYDSGVLFVLLNIIAFFFTNMSLPEGGP